MAEHRPKYHTVPMNVMGMVTKILTKSDKEYHTEGAKTAVRADMINLLRLVFGTLLLLASQKLLSSILTLVFLVSLVS